MNVRSIVAVIAVALAVVVLSIGRLVSAQTSDDTAAPPVEAPPPTVEIDLAPAPNDAAVPEASTARTGAEPPKVKMATVDVSEVECKDGSGDQTKLGLLERSAVYGRCP